MNSFMVNRAFTIANLLYLVDICSRSNILLQPQTIPILKKYFYSIPVGI